MPIFLVAQQSLTWKYFAVRANSEEQAQERVADKDASFEIGKFRSDDSKLVVEGPFASTSELMEMLSGRGYKIPWEQLDKPLLS